MRVCAVVVAVKPSDERTLVPPESGDFDVFYRREFAAIALVAGTTAGSRVRGEEIAQEALSRAAQRWAELSNYDRPGAWVRRVAINLALSERRRQASERKALRRLTSRAELRALTAEPRAGDPAVWAAVDDLPPRQRAVVVLHYFDDLQVAEIADILEISVSTVTSHLHKARTSLARLLDESPGAFS